MSLTTQCADYRKRSLCEAKRLLKKISSLLKKLTGDITTNELTAIIDKQSPSEAVHLFKILRTLFRFAVRRRIILSSPPIRSSASEKGEGTFSRSL